MPSEYIGRNKPMHAREVRYERSSDSNRDSSNRPPFSGKRDWRVALYDHRSPGPLNPVTNGYEPPAKRRASGRHGFPENGRYGNGREHRESMFSGGNTNGSTAPGTTGYSGYKNDRYVGMPHYAAGNGGRNGLKDGSDAGVDHIPSPSGYHSTQPGYFEDAHVRGPRYSGWDVLQRGDREHRPSISPDIPERRYSRVNGWDVQDKDLVLEGRIEGRLDRYGSSTREVFYSGEMRGRDHNHHQHQHQHSSVDVQHHDFSDQFKAGRLHQPPRTSSVPAVVPPVQRDERPSSPRKRPRLGWGQGLARHEQKKHVEEVDHHHVEPAATAATTGGDTSKPRVASEERRPPSEEPPAVATFKEPSPPAAARDVSPPVRDPSPPGTMTTTTTTTAAATTTTVATKEASPAPTPTDVSPVPESPQEAKPSTPMHDVLLSSSPIKEVPVHIPAAVEAEVVPTPTPLLDHCGEKEKGSDDRAASTIHETSVEQPPRESAEVSEQPSLPPPPPPPPEPEAVSTDGLSKDVVLLRVEQLELQIDSIEKELGRLDVDAGEGVAETSPHVDEMDVATSHHPEEHSEDVHMEDANPQPTGSADLVAELLESHYTAAEIVRVKAAFGHLLPDGWMEDGKKQLYSSPQESPFWAKNEEQHRAVRSSLIEQLAKKQEALLFKQKALTLKYRILKEKNQPRKRSKAYRNGMNPRKSADAETENAYLTRKMLAEPPNPYRDNERMPSMILDPKDRPMQHLLTANRLVDDGIKYEQDRKKINPWTAEEKKVFLEKFNQHYKNFAKIATFLDHKTVGDCIEFYYRNQKSEEFSKLRKKQKRHSKYSYMATTASGRAHREANAVSLHSAVATTAASCVGKNTRNSSNSLKVVDHHRERLTAVSDCVTLDASGKHGHKAGNHVSGSIVTGVCSLSSDAPLTPSTVPMCEKMFLQYTRQKGFRSSRRDKHGGGEAAETAAEVEWSDAERDLFLEAVPLFGKDFGRISRHVKSRCEAQCRTFFIKARKRLKLDRLVEQHQAAALVAAQVSGTVEVERKQPVNVNYMCEEPVEVVRPCKTSMNEDVEMSDAQDAATLPSMVTTNAATMTLVDSPVSSVITSPGVASMSSPAAPLKAPEDQHHPQQREVNSNHQQPLQMVQPDDLREKHHLANNDHCQQRDDDPKSTTTTCQGFEPPLVDLPKNALRLEDVKTTTPQSPVMMDEAKFDRNGIMLFGQPLHQQGDCSTSTSTIPSAAAAPLLIEDRFSVSRGGDAQGLFRKGCGLMNGIIPDKGSGCHLPNGVTCARDLQVPLPPCSNSSSTCSMKVQQQGLKDGLLYGSTLLQGLGGGGGGGGALGKGSTSGIVLHQHQHHVVGMATLQAEQQLLVEQREHVGS